MKVNFILFCLVFFLFGISFFIKAQNTTENNTENDAFYQKKINTAWQNNQIDSTLTLYQAYLEEINPKKEAEKYITFQTQRLRIAYLIGNTEIIEKSIQELKALKLNPKKEMDLIHQITFQEAKYEYWKGFYQKSLALFEQIPNHQESITYHLVNRNATSAPLDSTFLSTTKLESLQDSQFETASEQAVLLSKLFNIYAMPNEAFLFAQKAIDYLPSTANQIEIINVQIEYVDVLFYQKKLKEGQQLLDSIEKIIRQYAPKTELELRWHCLQIIILLEQRQIKKAEIESDSVWIICQKFPITNAVVESLIKTRSGMLLETRKWQEQEELIDKYLKLFTELYTEDSEQVLQLYLHKTFFYFHNNFYQNVIEYSDKILKNNRASITLRTEVYKMNAFAYSKLRDYEASLFYAEKYLTSVKKSVGEKHLRMAAVYYLLSSVHREQGNLQQAIEYAKYAIEIYEVQEEIITPTAIASAHQVIVNSYLKLEENENALFHALEAKKIIEGLFLKNRFYALGQTYSNVGIVYRSLEKYDSAYRYYHLSLAAETSLPEKNRNKASIGRIYNNLGYAFEKQHNYDSAIFYYQKAILEKENSTQSWSGANAINNLGNCFFAINDFKKAELNYKKALEINVLGKEYADLEVALDSYKGLASLNTFSFSQRLNYYRKADELIDKIRSRVHTDSDQLFISKQTTEIYGKALSTCFEATQIQNVEEQIYEDAFYFAEKNRAFLLRKQTQETLVMEQVPENLRKKDAKYTSLIDYYQREILELEVEEKTEKQNSTLAYYNQQILETRKKHQELKTELSTTFESYQNLQESIELVTTQTLKQNLKEGEQLIVYQWFEPYLFIQVITKTEQLFYRIKPIDFEETVKEYRNCLAKDCDTEKFVIQSNALYKSLIQPIEAQIQAGKKLIIIPDAILQQIPFSTLVNITKSTSEQNGDVSYQTIDYPLLKYQISFHYSSSLWLLARQKKDINYDYEFIGFAPVFEDDKENSNPLFASNRGDLSPLPYSKQEVEQVANLFTLQNKKSLAFINFQANQENLKSYATKTRRLHLATHSQTFTKTPFNSHIWLFGQDSTQNKIPQKLYASDFYAMSFPNELVVLSSCRSGVGQVVEGEGVITLTRSFLNAGTKNIIFSLWQIDDLATKELMTLFYGFVTEGKTYSESLQLAKQKLSKSDKFKNPFYWAGFLLIGE